MRRISALLDSSLHTSEGIVASALPVPLAGGAIGGWRGLMNGLFGLNGRLRVYLEEYRGQLRSTAFVYDGRRPEWVVLMLAALPEPGGTDSAFRLLSGISASAARSGMQRLFAADARARSDVGRRARPLPLLCDDDAARGAARRAAVGAGLRSRPAWRRLRPTASHRRQSARDAPPDGAHRARSDQAVRGRARIRRDGPPSERAEGAYRRRRRRQGARSRARSRA